MLSSDTSRTRNTPPLSLPLPHQLGRNKARGAALLLAATTLASPVESQGTAREYEKAETVAQRIDGLTIDLIESSNWLAGNRFAYRKTVDGGGMFYIADVNTREKKPAFDHARIAAALTSITRKDYAAATLPFRTYTFADNERAIDISIDSLRYRCSLVDYSCAAISSPTAAGMGGRGGRAGGGGGGGGGVGALRQVFGGGLYGSDGGRSATVPPRLSPDRKKEAFVRDHNIWIRDVVSKQTTQLSLDGAEGNAYDIQSISWSPNSQVIAAYRVIPGFQRQIHYVQSSPSDQLQPKLISRLYSKPGDELDKPQPVIFNVETGKQTNVSNELFPNAYTMSALRWRQDGRAVHFEYNQRGHQAFRVIEIDPASGVARAVVNEEAKTFITYSSKRYRYDIADGRETIWMSERDGWNHLYRLDGSTSAVKNQITKGNWVVRGVDLVDTVANQIWFRASGVNANQDPYFIHYYRINIDGSGLTALTSENGNHSVSFSPDRAYYSDTWSRVDMPPVTVIKRTSDQSVVLEVEKANAAPLFAAGFRAPEPFVAKARDDSTNIYGIIVRPSNFDAKRKYPVIEYIYAGPHDSFVPKSWGIPVGMQAQAELGFIVVQIDGMGTSNRSKVFHDVAWQNIGDGGFPDRIKWHKAVAAKYSNYDVTRVGIYGGSAGGQNSTGALLFHPDFYKVAVSFVGCHDNRMDKIWWNEQWMGWPIGPHYSRSSNVDNAWRLQGKLLLIVGEMDENVDPASTYQVANALIKANKSFDLFVFPNGDHAAGRRGDLAPYGNRKQWDYFVQHLHDVPPPNRNVATAPTTPPKIGGDLSYETIGESWNDILSRWSN